MYYHALINISTGSLVSINNSLPILAKLSECTMDSKRVPNANYPHYMDSSGQEPFFLLAIDPVNYPEWRWSWTTRRFTRTRPSTVSDKMRSLARLTQAKGNALNEILFYLNITREPIGTGLILQESIYATKRMQAEAFKDNSYDEGMLLEIPYVVQYADIAGISLKQAADDILFKAKLDDHALVRSESLRIQYFRKVCESKDPNIIPEIVQEFINHCIHL